MATTDPVTGEPIGDYLIDPNVVGSSEEVADLDGTTHDAPTQEPKRTETQPSVRIHIDTSEDDWLDKVGEAYTKAAKALGFDPADFEGKKPILIKGPSSIMDGPEEWDDQRDQ